MPNILQKLLPKTPEISSDFLEDAPEIYTWGQAIERGQATKPEAPKNYQEVRRQVGRTANFVGIDHEVNTEVAVTGDIKRRIEHMTNITANIIAKRNAEIQRDGGLRFTARNLRSKQKVSYAEIVLGKKMGAKAGRAVEKVMTIGFQPTESYQARENEYIYREAQASQRAIGHQDTQLFPLDSHTWVWDTVGSDGNQKVYEIELGPTWVTKRLMTDIGVNSRTLFDSSEVAQLDLLISQVEEEVMATVYLQSPAEAKIDAGNYAIAA